MSPALLKRLLEIPNVTMIKESTGDIQRMHTLKSMLGEEVAFYNGSNPLALGAFAAGASGWCTAAPNLIPELNLALYDAVVKGDYKKAGEEFYKQLALLKFIVEKGLPRAIKTGLNLMGEAGGELRKPLASLTADETKDLARILGSVAKVDAIA
ncbi:4-hydroxy-tetrahydrodipicolinate synthase [compost metagenome]